MSKQPRVHALHRDWPTMFVFKMGSEHDYDNGDHENEGAGDGNAEFGRDHVHADSMMSNIVISRAIRIPMTL